MLHVPASQFQTETSPAGAVAPAPVLIVGGGIAGALLALVLARRGQRVTLVDIRREPTPEFRNEKLGIGQIERLAALGVLSCFQQACWGADAAPADGLPPPGRPALKDCGARYDQWIRRIRAAWPETVQFVEGKVDRLETSDDAQALVLTDGRRIPGRLIVLATGRGERLRAQLGIERRVVSPRHSTCLGFSVMPGCGDPWSIAAKIFPGRRNGMAYATIFPMADEVRVNVFSYLGVDHPWVAAMRRDPIATLTAAEPATARLLADTVVVRPPEARSTDLYQVEGHVQPGVVLLGDAFHAPCPASGTGLTRILNDIDRLANRHIPAWLSTPGMGAEKIAAFYGDPAKLQVDDASLQSSMRGRASVMSGSLYWRARRAVGEVKRVIALTGT